MKSRRIAVVTVLAMAACILTLSVVLSSGGAKSWALPVFLTVIAVVFTTGLVLTWRATGQASRSDRRK